MPVFTLIAADDPMPQALAEAEARIRAGILADYLTARSRRDHTAALLAEQLAAQVDDCTPDGPRLLDELYGASLGDVA
jgi:hypothetical protein